MGRVCQQPLSDCIGWAHHSNNQVRFGLLKTLHTRQTVIWNYELYRIECRANALSPVCLCTQDCPSIQTHTDNLTQCVCAHTHHHILTTPCSYSPQSFRNIPQGVENTTLLSQNSVVEHLSFSLSRKINILSNYNTLDTRHM